MNKDEITVLPDNGNLYKESSNLYLNMYKYAILTSKCKIKSFLDKKFDEDENIRGHKLYKSNFVEKELLKKIQKQMNLIISAYEPNVLRFKFGIKNRMIIGNSGGNYGNVSVIALHPTYCIPYIPGSAIKGAFRSYMIYTKYNGDENAAMRSESFVKLFGSSNNGDEEEKEDSGKRGKVVFLDAFPEKEFKIEQDVQTVHYAQYYEGKCEPTDDLNRIPITMYTVGKTIFLIGAVFDAGVFNENELAEIEACFKETFTDFGIGARTSIGYGLGNIVL
ncbi:MAG: hypothetical protein ACFWTJ_10090 [Lachnoclostridium sp.]